MWGLIILRGPILIRWEDSIDLGISGEAGSMPAGGDTNFAAIAQLEEHSVGIGEVLGASPCGSTTVREARGRNQI